MCRTPIPSSQIVRRTLQSTKFVTLTIYDNMNREERCFRIKLSDPPSEQAIHIKTDHDYVEDLICIRDIIHRVDKIYDKYIKIVV